MRFLLRNIFKKKIITAFKLLKICLVTTYLGHTILISYQNLLPFIHNCFKYMICNILWPNTWISLRASALPVKRMSWKCLPPHPLGILHKTPCSEDGRSGRPSVTHATGKGAPDIQAHRWCPKDVRGLAWAPEAPTWIHRTVSANGIRSLSLRNNSPDESPMSAAGALNYVHTWCCFWTCQGASWIKITTLTTKL